jgi:hypothetical protein
MKPRFLISDRFRALLFGLTEGALLASLVVNVRDAVREDAFFRDIATRAVSNATTAEDQILALMKKTYQMVGAIRRGVEDGSVEDVSGLAHYRRLFLDSMAHSALYPDGFCGSYSGILVKLLKAGGFPVGFGQMLDRADVNGIAHHIIVEVWLDGRWVICDPMYNLVFRGDDGRILGVEEIRRDWDRLKAQCPPEYDMRYDYSGYRRVNFGRLNPWLQKTPLAKWSIRTWLVEGAWLRSALVASLLALVIAIHAWYERLGSRGRVDGSSNPHTVARAAASPESVAPMSSPARSAAGVSAKR